MGLGGQDGGEHGMKAQSKHLPSTLTPNNSGCREFEIYPGLVVDVLTSPGAWFSQGEANLGIILGFSFWVAEQV